MNDKNVLIAHPDDLFASRLPDSEKWFDLWHTHVDWRGGGSKSADPRREYIRALFAAWERVEAFAAGLPCPWQSWLVFDEADSGQDAVYLHTPNPNHDNFPYEFEGVTWGATPPVWLADFLTNRLDFGRSNFDGEALYWVRRTSNLVHELVEDN